MDYKDFDRQLSKKKSNRKFNRRLNVSHISVEEDDTSCGAGLIRMMTEVVSQLVTPRQLITALFLVAAYTIMLLVTTILSDLIFVYYEFFHGLSDEVSMKLGNLHDAKIRLFGIAFAVLSIMVELDLKFVEKNVKILKLFIPRSILLLFVGTLSATNPMITYEWKQGYESSSSSSSYFDDDDGNDFYGSNFSNSYESSNSTGYIRDEIPTNVLRLQAFSSTLLHGSVILYFLLGLLCLDRFLPNAFIPGNDHKIASDHLPQEMSGEQRGSSGRLRSNSNPDGYMA